MVRKTKKYGRKTKSVKKYKKGGSVKKNNYKKFSRKNNNQNNFYNNLIKQIQNKFIKGGAWTGTQLSEKNPQFRVVKLESKPNTNSNVSEITAEILPDANMPNEGVDDKNFATKFAGKQLATTHILAEFQGVSGDKKVELKNFIFNDNVYTASGDKNTTDPEKVKQRAKEESAKVIEEVVTPENREEAAAKAEAEAEAVVPGLIAEGVSNVINTNTK